MSEKPKSSEAIARWAEQQTKPAHTPAYKRLTDTDRVLITRLHKQGLSQVEIAQRLGCDQSSVSRWLAACQDSTKEATAYLRGQALRMSRHIVQKGRAADHIKALEGISVLQPQASQPITWQIGIKADTVKLIPSTFASDVSAVTEDIHRLSEETGSDNTQLC